MHLMDVIIENLYIIVNTDHIVNCLCKWGLPCDYAT